MCGIVGVYGKNPEKTLIDRLYRLEYRGYDSAGIAVKVNTTVNLYKAKGEIKNLEKTVEITPNAQLGIGHTRWATHGKPDETNAHPHTSADGKWTIVHNGIIENYTTIKADLTKKGYKGRKIPYLEIRSRDCLNNNFIARVLCYDVSVEDFIKNLSKLEENVKKQGFSCKGIVRKRKGKEIFPKQIGYTENLTAISDDDFIKLVDIWGEKYLNAMKDWC